MVLIFAVLYCGPAWAQYRASIADSSSSSASFSIDRFDIRISGLEVSR